MSRLHYTDEQLDQEIHVQRGFIERQRMIVRQADDQLQVDTNRLRRLLHEKYVRDQAAEEAAKPSQAERVPLAVGHESIHVPVPHPLATWSTPAPTPIEETP